MKICRICKKSKPLKDFHKSSRHAKGVKNECAKCTNFYLRQHYNKNYKGTKERKLKNLNNYYKRKFNITYNDYLKMYKDRAGYCDICERFFKRAGTEGVGSKNILVLDHCHETNKIRGLICQKCNQGLGLFEDNSDFLTNAHLYLLQTETDKAEK